eukprot:5473978-Pyramimonas_sp.AAC.1
MHQDTDALWSDALKAYTLLFMPYTTGRVLLDYKLAGETLLRDGMLPSRPVVPGPAVAAQCTYSGKAGTAGAVVGRAATFYVQARDQYGFSLTGKASGTFRASFAPGSTMTAAVVYEGEGRYNVTYLAANPGLAELFLNYDNLPVGGSPLRL